MTKVQVGVLEEENFEWDFFSLSRGNTRVKSFGEKFFSYHCSELSGYNELSRVRDRDFSFYLGE